MGLEQHLEELKRDFRERPAETVGVYAGMICGLVGGLFLGDTITDYMGTTGGREYLLNAVVGLGVTPFGGLIGLSIGRIYKNKS